jgi:DeoR family transcriptional regulator of aga operon
MYDFLKRLDQPECEAKQAMTTNRQLRILNHLAINDEMDVTALSELLDVSTSTIRRELTLMEESGLLVRTHGAARLPTPISYEAPYEKRAADHVEEKRKIAAVARQVIAPGSVVGIMGGTTCTELARQMRAMEHVTVVTNALNIPLELQGRITKRVMVTGGILNQNSYELIGSQASASLENVHLTTAFIGVSGISVEFGFSMSDEPEAAVGRSFMQAADRTIVLADSSKIGKETFARLCPLSGLQTLITDDGIGLDQIDALQNAGLEVIVAPLKG